MLFFIEYEIWEAFQLSSTMGFSNGSTISLMVWLAITNWDWKVGALLTQIQKIEEKVNDCSSSYKLKLGRRFDTCFRSWASFNKSPH